MVLPFIESEIITGQQPFFNVTVNQIAELGRQVVWADTCNIAGVLQSDSSNKPQILICTDKFNLANTGDFIADNLNPSIDLGRGADVIASAGHCGIGLNSNSPSLVNLGDGSDTINCGEGIFVSGSSSLLLGAGDDLVNGTISATNGYGCAFGGLDAGSGNDVILCSGNNGGILVGGNIVNLGGGKDRIDARVYDDATNIEPTCSIRAGGQILGGNGQDELNCFGGSNSIGLEVSGTGISGVGSKIDMGDDADTVFVENDIYIEGSASFELGNGADNVTTNGCLRGNIDLGSGHDSLFAKAVSGTIFGGDGNDCYEPTAPGAYNYSCTESVVTLTAPHGTTCASVRGSTSAPAVTLDSIEQIGCETVIFDPVNFPATCDGSADFYVVFTIDSSHHSRLLRWKFRNSSVSTATTKPKKKYNLRSRQN